MSIVVTNGVPWILGVVTISMLLSLCSSNTQNLQSPPACDTCIYIARNRSSAQSLDKLRNTIDCDVTVVRIPPSVAEAVLEARNHNVSGTLCFLLLADPLFKCLVTAGGWNIILRSPGAQSIVMKPVLKLGCPRAIFRESPPATGNEVITLFSFDDRVSTYIEDVSFQHFPPPAYTLLGFGSQLVVNRCDFTLPGKVCAVCMSMRSRHIKLAIINSSFHLRPVGKSKVLSPKHLGVIRVEYRYPDVRTDIVIQDSQFAGESHGPIIAFYYKYKRSFTSFRFWNSITTRIMKNTFANINFKVPLASVIQYNFAAQRQWLPCCSFAHESYIAGNRFLHISGGTHIEVYLPPGFPLRGFIHDNIFERYEWFPALDVRINQHKGKRPKFIPSFDISRCQFIHVGERWSNAIPKSTDLPSSHISLIAPTTSIDKAYAVTISNCTFKGSAKDAVIESFNVDVHFRESNIIIVQ